MTRARFCSDGLSWTIHIAGHSGHHVDGVDVVCAACSMLTCLLYDFIRSNEECFESDKTVIDNNAFLHAELTVKPKDAARIRAVIDTIKRGFEMLAEEYPQNVQYEENTV